MAQRRGKDLAEMFEIISGSDTLKTEYEELQKAKEEKESELGSIV